MTKVQMRRWFRDWEHRGAAAEFARKLGKSRAFMSMWLNDKRPSATFDAEVPKLIAKWRAK